MPKKFRPAGDSRQLKARTLKVNIIGDTAGMEYSMVSVRYFNYLSLPDLAIE
jgi:hypothetical protein